ncbi:hypothetical protein Tco_1208996 [Tanacetum coccineum]
MASQEALTFDNADMDVTELLQADLLQMYNLEKTQGSPWMSGSLSTSRGSEASPKALLAWGGTLWVF